MEFVRQWLTSVVCAALITALAQGLMPKGAVRQVGKLVCALVLLCALLRPVLTLHLPNVPDTFGLAAGQTEQKQVQLEQRSGAMLKTLIERQSAAYIVDKAARMGLNCQVKVVCRAGEGGTWLPQSVYITGEMDAGQQTELATAIHTEFGIAQEYQVYTGGE